MTVRKVQIRRLEPGKIAEDLYCLDPDRDERAAQLCAETLLTLAENGYKAPTSVTELRSPKRQRFALRSLALGENFLGEQDKGRVGDDRTSPEAYGASLANGEAIRGSTHLRLAQLTLQGVVDPDTQRGVQPGCRLLRPFHEELLWYDARKVSPSRPAYTVRKVYMRGSGITLARLLADPPDPAAAELGRNAVDAIREALTTPSPLADIGHHLEAALPNGAAYTTPPPKLEDDEKDAWVRGADQRLAKLASSLCRHAEGVMRQGGASGPAKLWQLRTILALDLAIHALRTAWDVTDTATDDRFLLLSFGDAPRSMNAVRQRAEDSYRRARIRLSEATVRTLARRMYEIDDGRVDWAREFGPRSGLDVGDESLSSRLAKLRRPAAQEEYAQLARSAAESANYGRAEDGFRVLLESVGLLSGTGAYRYLTGTPDLLSALVGALSSDMPMASRDFFSAVRREWGFVINQESAAGTGLATQLDGVSLERNARRAERLMADAGLAVGLSDRTTVVGERAARSFR